MIKSMRLVCVSVTTLALLRMAPAAERGAWFREARFGMFIHWGIYSIPAKGEWSYANDKYAPGEYEANAKRFNPVNYNPREWAKLAKAAGMKYAVLTSRHHDGFCMFDSHFTDYKITKSPYGKDAVREFLEAFRAEGLRVGLYHSLPDWTHPGYADTESPECIAGGKKVPHVPTPEQYASFTNLVYNHVNQLTTEYGRLDLLFLDYTSQTKANVDYFGRDRLLEMIYRNQPDILVNDRLSYYKDNCRDFDYYTPEICVPNQPQTVKGREVMWETCATMNDHWGYCREDRNWKTPEAVIAGLVGCVSRNGNLLLNVGPTELGDLPEGTVKILKALADWQAVHGESVTGCGKAEFTPPYGCAYTQRGNALYCHFLQSPLGDTILPQLKGRIAKATLLRTGEEMKQVNHWGFELLKSDEQRLRTRGIEPGDVVRLDLDDVTAGGCAKTQVADDDVTVPSAGTASVADFCRRAKAGKPLTVTFFGGSLTWGANASDPNCTSWRGRICERLRKTYPNTPFRFVDAAIGGTGSELGIFRLERDVLKFKPDLVFHEWSVNDGFVRSSDNASCSYEGIIRRVLVEVPGCVPVPVILPDRKTMTTEPEANLRRRAEHLVIAERYNLNAVDVLGTLRKVYKSGKDETDLIWPAEIGDNTHPHDYGYGVYADVIWDAVFAHPSDRVPKLTPEPMFPPKYAHVCRLRLNALGWLPEGWAKGYNAMRAGTFDFLCSRRQDGVVRATNKGGKNPSPFKFRFRGEVLLLYGESTVKSGNCEIWVDGKRAASRDCSDFGALFAPSAYLLWPIASNLDSDKIHELEIRPILKDGEAQEVNIESVCVAGCHGAWVRQMCEPKVSVDGCARVKLSDDCVLVSSTGAVSFVRIKWPHEMPRETLVLNDAWERSYGDLEWKGLAETRVSSWYYLASVSNRTWGVGVETGPGAMCCWEVTTNGTTLVLDLRAGGQPVRLGGRTLKACRIVRSESREGESAWDFGRRFCKMMCPKPKLPKSPVYGYNDWYCAYGKNTATNFLADAAYIMECAKGCANPPYVVMDDGWQKNSPPVVHESGRGPWDAAGPNFGMDMSTFCGRIAALGAKPGLWYRPLRAWDELPDEQRLLANRDYLDPTVPAVKARIVEDVRRFRDWGVKLVKIDFLSYDLAQLWPCDPHPHCDRYIQDDRAWRDSSRTTAEVMRELYQTMKDAAGDDVVIIGCNALNHLAAGVFELQRTGNDTSGKDWSWTRNNGVNTLAMRSIQDGAFFKIDADCVGLAEGGAVPWELNRQWMDLLGRSGTPMFVSWHRQLAGPEVRKALADAFRRASSERPTIEPVDWQRTRTPNKWRDADGTVDYDWK